MPTVLMTGGHRGLGLQAARTLAKRFGCNLVRCRRDPERVKEAVRQLRMQAGVTVVAVPTDLSSVA